MELQRYSDQELHLLSDQLFEQLMDEPDNREVTDRLMEVLDAFMSKGEREAGSNRSLFSFLSGQQTDCPRCGNPKEVISLPAPQPNRFDFCPSCDVALTA